VRELTHPVRLRSSAARSSLSTILLLQPVFFLRSVTTVSVSVARGPQQELALGRLALGAPPLQAAAGAGRQATPAQIL